MVGYRIEQNVAVLEVAQPPLNGLSRAVRAGLMEAVDRAEEDDRAAAIMLIGAGETFPAGADVLEYDTGLKEPSLRDLCDRIDYCGKPVVAALTGTVYGGGLELALAAHYRVAHIATRFGFPEVHLGLPPAGGGSQRLPRLVGAQQTLAMLIGGKIVRAEKSAGNRLIDMRTDGDVRQAALAFCDRLIAEGRGPRRLAESIPGGRDPMAFQSTLAAARARLGDDHDSFEAQLLTLIEASALLPFEAGLDLEAEVFADCVVSDRARALRHSFLAERRAAQGDSAADSEPPIRAVALFGTGTLAVQLAARILSSRVALRWAAHDQDALKSARGMLERLLLRGVETGTPAEARVRRLLEDARLGAAQEMLAGADAGIIADRGYDDLTLPDGFLAATAYPDRVRGIGLRFVPPADSARLVEIMQGPGASLAQVARAGALVRCLGKLPVHVTSERDTLAGRLSQAMQSAADALIDLGESPRRIDAALEGWGLGRGLFAARDRRSLVDLARVPREHGENWSARLVAAGRMGAAEGGGYFDWKDGQPQPSAAVDAILDSARPPQTIAADLIVRVIIGAAANEGLRLLEEGKAARASDLDIVSIHALGVPQARGGVMKAVTLWGLFSVMKQMERLGHPDQAIWAAHPEWMRLVRNGQSFDAL
ncbi:enoyl-CoA hydratase-related protein [Primorskyibacter sp. 2E107]|uniref:enoyl-CoA hydratase-related protein n=1 Tax=Primorskyibacter sp. 2E107 TaxID=3403458 RepID=UPI003AF5F7B7